MCNISTLLNSVPSRKHDTVQLLKYYSLAGVKSGAAPGPVWGWRFHVALPLLLYLGLLLGTQLTDTKKGMVATLGLVAILVLLYNHTHRLKHICR